MLMKISDDVRLEKKYLMYLEHRIHSMALIPKHVSVSRVLIPRKTKTG